jgi:glycosyltransferase involved in cell wall biosynthesis
MDLGRYDWSHRMTDFLQRLMIRRPDRIVVNSHAGRDFAASRGFPGSLQTVIANGIDTKKFAHDPDAGRSIRNGWGVSQSNKLIGIVARLDPMKDHHTFLKAAAVASDRDPGLRFVCVGDGAPDYRAELQAFATGLGLDDRITWAGECRDLPAIYSALDLATLTSAFGEGFPNTVGEAMACEIPCVVTDVGDAAFVVDQTGVVIPPSQPQALAEAWGTMMDEPPSVHQARGRDSRDRILENFSISIMVQSHAEMYQVLISMPDRSH